MNNHPVMDLYITIGLLFRQGFAGRGMKFVAEADGQIRGQWHLHHEISIRIARLIDRRGGSDRALIAGAKKG